MLVSPTHTQQPMPYEIETSPTATPRLDDANADLVYRCSPPTLDELVAMGSFHMQTFACHRSQSTCDPNRPAREQSVQLDVAYGGFSRVHMYRTVLTGPAIAVKQLESPEPSLSNRYHHLLSFLQSEASVHPNLNRCLGVAECDRTSGVYKTYFFEGSSEGDLYDCMIGRIANYSLQETHCIVRQHSHVTLSVILVTQVAAGLSWMHERGWVHCDVKPENILVFGRNGAVLCDFDFATPVGEARLSGTVEHIAPERRYMNAGATPEWDVWSLGVVLYSLLTYQTYTVFDGDVRTLDIVNAAVCNEASRERAIRVLRNLHGDRPYIVQLVDDMLQINPEQRICARSVVERCAKILHKLVPSTFLPSKSPTLT